MTVHDGTDVPTVVSAAEAAELLGISQVAACGLARRGRTVPGAVRFAHMWWIPTLELETRYRDKLGKALTAETLRAVTDRD